MYKVIIIDDEVLARNRLKNLLKEFSQSITLVGEFSNAHEAYDFLQKNSVDILFLDISMPGMSGIELGDKLKNLPCFIVYVTAHNEFSLKSFDHNTMDYLLKPVSLERLTSTIKKIHSLRPIKPSVQLKIGQNYYEVLIDEISCIIADGQYCKYIAGKKEFLEKETLESLLEKFKSFGFKQTHRSSIVNPRFIEKITKVGDRKCEIHLCDESKTILQLSRSFINDFILS